MFRPALCVAVVVIAACARPAAPPPAEPDLVADVRTAIAGKDFAAGARVIDAYRASRGVTPQVVDALSVLAFTASSAKAWDVAEKQALVAYEIGGALLKGRSVDEEPKAPTGVGRAIEVLALASVERGARSDAIAFLERELATYKSTSIEKRIQKNINLLTLAGAAAPPLDLTEYIGAPPPTIASLKGRVVLMFFWAHWCADCKAQGPILARLVEKYEPRGLTIVGPTQRFGYVAGGETAAPAVENPYIDAVRQQYYPVLANRPIPLSDANHRRYGVSSTPTLVVVDRKGIIRLYHPGRLSEEDLDALLGRLVAEAA